MLRRTNYSIPYEESFTLHPVIPRFYPLFFNSACRVSFRAGLFLSTCVFHFIAQSSELSSKLSPYLLPENIERLTEDQAFSLSFDLAPPPPLPPPPRCQQFVSLYQSSCVLPVELTAGRGGGARGGAKSYDGEKA
jgi:hypothetical protein